MNLKVLPVVLGGVLVFCTGALWGVLKKHPAEVSCSILLQPKLGDAKGALAELAGDSASPLMVLKGTVESHSCLAKISAIVGTEEKKLKKLLQVQPIAKELRMELTYRGPEAETGIRVLNATLDVLNDESLRISESFGTQQASGLKKLIAQRVAELDRANGDLSSFQKSLESNLDFVKARQTVLTLETRLQSAKIELDSYVQQQAKRLANPELGDWNPALQKLRVEKDQISNELKLALVSLGDENPTVLLLRKKLQVAQSNFAAEVERLRQSEEKNLQIKSASLRSSVVELERQLKLARRNEQLASTESIKLAKLKAEVETISSVLKNLRTAYEQARITGSGSPGTWAVLDAPYVLPEASLSDKILKFGGLGLFGYLGLLVLIIVYRFAMSQRSSLGDEQ